MRIRMAVSMSGSRAGVEWPPVGGELEVDDVEGAQLCGAGLAVPVKVDKVERAVAPKAEIRKARVAKDAETDSA